MHSRIAARAQLALSLAIFACGIVPGAACAQDDADPFHAAYSAAFGRGRYTLGDGTWADIYRGNFSKKFRDSRAEGGERAGIRLLLPIAVGEQALEDEDIPAGREDRRVEHASFLPGVELEFAPGERWILRTRAQIGAAKDFETDGQSAALATVGVRSRVTFREAAGRPSLINGVLWAGFDPDDGERRSLVRFTTGVEFEVPAARWRVRDGSMSFRPHVLWDGYYRPSARSPAAGRYAQVDSEWQLGVAAQRDDGFKLLFLRFDAVGVAYRFSEHSAGLRIYLNSAF